MSVKIINENGSIVIDDQALAAIAGLAAMECYGVVGMASRNATQGFLNF